MVSTPTFRIVRTPARGHAIPELDRAQRQVVDHPGGLLRVVAGPGSGKTTTLVEAVAERAERRGVPVDHLLVLTFSRHAAAQLRDRIAARLRNTVSEPVARTFHSYAFGVVRQAAALTGAPAPRLLSGSEQDVTIRELLAGRLSDQRDDWPAELRAALRLNAFAEELRELLMRAIERDIPPDRLAQLGRQYRRPEWTVAAGVLEEYLQVTALKAPGAFDAAELIQRARAELLADDALLAAERRRRRRIFVDEFHDTDPAQIELLRLLAHGADELIVFGDPDQSIYAFRGAESNVINDVDARFGGLLSAEAGLGAELSTVMLTSSWRSNRALLVATRRVADRVGGGLVGHRGLTSAAVGHLDGAAGAGEDEDGACTVAVFPSAPAEAAYIATVLRRAHIEQGVAWSDMAVLVRAGGPSADSLKRGLSAAGVPVGQQVAGPLASEPLVTHLLALLRAVNAPDQLTDADAEQLLTGPVARLDPLQLTRLRRRLVASLPGSADLTVLLTEPGGVALAPPGLEHRLRRLRRVLRAGREAVVGSRTAEEILWAVWDASGLAPRLESRSVAGGVDGARADRDLDAVIALFAEASKLTERAPGAGPEQIERWIGEIRIADAAPVSSGAADSVAFLTAHASKGREWELVCVAGVQEGTWPNLRTRGTLLATSTLVDIAAGRPPQTAALAGETLREERRLFYVAVTRARRRLVVTGLATQDDQPSRFLDELDPLPEDMDNRPVRNPPRPFELTGLVAQLRAAVLEGDSDSEAAAHELARLASAGVRGADPAHWWSVADLSSTEPIRPVGAGPVPIRPSKFEAYAECELRALFADLAAVDASDSSAASLGTLLHLVAELAPDNATDVELTQILDAHWSNVEFPAPWYARAERARAQRMLAALARWLRDSRSELTEIARENPFSVLVGDAQLSGKVDRLEQDTDGRLVVIDVKTGKNKPSEKKVSEHAQLAMYQLAVVEGAFTGGRPAVSGGARLVQIGTNASGEQRQQPLSEFADPDWVRSELARIAAVLRGNSVTARPGPGCPRCPARLSCPAQREGRQVTG